MLLSQNVYRIGKKCYRCTSPIQITSAAKFCSVLQFNGNLKSLEERTLYDLAIVGGGIIGSAIAREVRRKSKVKTILIEKENNLGRHQSSHNSGVIHSGIYYRPGSLKAQLCIKGAKLIYKYCQDNNIAYKTGGKLIVATDCTQSQLLHGLYNRGQENHVDDLKMLDSLEDIIKIEPDARGMQALLCPTTGNVDYKIVTESFGNDFRINGGDILLNNEVNCIKTSGDSDYPILIKCNENLFLKAKFLILCGGLQSGPLSDLVEKDKTRIFISFRVDYQLLKNKCIPVNIYALPDLDLPFLGVHLSPRLDGTTLLGPVAVPAFAIEGYKKEEVNLNYIKNTIKADGFQNMTKRYCSKCIDQVTKQICPNLLLKELQKLAHLREEDVCPGPVAVQNQLLNQDGTFTDDYVFEFFDGCGIRKRIINCKFTPSPAATSSMAIAEHVTDKFLKVYLKCT